MSVKSCLNCHGTRLNEAARHVFIKNKNIADITKMNIDEALIFFQKLNIKGTRGEIASHIIKEIQERLLFLSNVGLNYLNLERSAETLSGGESQRIRLASQIGSGLVGVMRMMMMVMMEVMMMMMMMVMMVMMMMMMMVDRKSVV